jgi:hypothetical protein
MERSQHLPRSVRRESGARRGRRAHTKTGRRHSRFPNSQRRARSKSEAKNCTGQRAETGRCGTRRSYEQNARQGSRGRDLPRADGARAAVAWVTVLGAPRCAGSRDGPLFGINFVLDSPSAENEALRFVVSAVSERSSGCEPPAAPGRWGRSPSGCLGFSDHGLPFPAFTNRTQVNAGTGHPRLSRPLSN